MGHMYVDRQYDEKEVIQVQCYSGYTYAGHPVSFIWQGLAYEISETEREWREPGKKCFLVRTENDRLFELCYKEQEDIWTIVEKVKRAEAIS